MVAFFSTIDDDSKKPSCLLVTEILPDFARSSTSCSVGGARILRVNGERGSLSDDSNTSEIRAVDNVSQLGLVRSTVFKVAASLTIVWIKLHLVSRSESLERHSFTFEIGAFVNTSVDVSLPSPSISLSNFVSFSRSFSSSFSSSLALK